MAIRHGWPDGRMRTAARSLALPAGIVFLTVVVVTVAAPRLSFVEVKALDVLFALVPCDESEPHIRIVDVGADTTAYDHLRSPGDTAEDRLRIPRAAYVRLTECLRRWGARTVVFDLIFERRSPDEDRALAREFAAAENVIIPAVTNVRPGAVGFKRPVEILASSVRAIGSPAAHQPNATIRSIPLVVTDYDTGYRYSALSVLALHCFEGTDPSQMRLVSGRRLIAAGREVPLLTGERICLFPSLTSPRPADGTPEVEIVHGDVCDQSPSLASWNTMLVNWMGPAGTVEPYLLADVLEMHDEEGRRVFGDRAVIVGKTDWEQHWTAVGPMSGPEIQANALHTLISGKFIRPVSPGVFYAMLVILAICAHSAVRFLRSGYAALIIALLLLIPLGLGRELLVRTNVWLYVIHLQIGVVLAAGSTMIAESGRVSALLGRLIPSFIGPPQRLPVGEVRTIEATVLFSDIRGYTATAERLPPDSVLEVLERYHSVVEDVVQDYGGTVVKRPGDAAVAIFWREYQGANHARCALEAAREMLRRISRMEVAAGGESIAFDAGVGINSGSVATGLVGTHQLEPTVIGDPVNVAQRLETLTKAYEYRILYSESTRARAGACDGECIGPVQLPGRTTRTTVYGLSVEPRQTISAESRNTSMEANP